MTIKEIKNIVEKWGEKYEDIEVYEPIGIGDHYPTHFHTDNCNMTDNWNDNSEIELWELMTMSEIEHSLLANTSGTWNDYYPDYNENDKVLVCMLKN